jgi:hypothetical protein
MLNKFGQHSRVNEQGFLLLTMNLYLTILYKFVPKVHHWAKYHATIDELCFIPCSLGGIEEDNH